MKTWTMAALLVTGCTLAACERASNPQSNYDPKVDGVNPTSLDRPINRSILDNQKRAEVAIARPVETPSTTTPPADSTPTTPAADTATPSTPETPTTPATPEKPADAGGEKPSNPIEIPADKPVE